MNRFPQPLTFAHDPVQYGLQLCDTDLHVLLAQTNVSYIKCKSTDAVHLSSESQLPILQVCVCVCVCVRSPVLPAVWRDF